MSNFNTVDHIRLVDEQTGEIKRLDGFKKGHRVPDAATARDAAFLADIASNELDNDLVATFDALRSVYGFKRREISVSGPEEGFGAISTACFNYEIGITQVEDQPSHYCLQRRITEIREPARILSAEFETVFPDRFRTIEIVAESDFDLESIIDHIEDAESKNVSVDYDKDITWCSIVVGDVTIRINGNRIRMVDGQKGRGLRKLFEAFQGVQRQFIHKLEFQGDWFAEE